MEANEPIEVNPKTYKKLIADESLKGLYFHRKDEESGKYFIKIASEKYISYFESIINRNQ